MAIDALADVTADPTPGPGHLVVRFVCACTARYVAAGHPDPVLLAAWVRAHAHHDADLPARAGVVL